MAQKKSDIKRHQNFFCDLNLQRALKKSKKIKTAINNQYGSFLIYPLFKDFTIIYTNANPTIKVKKYLKKLSNKHNAIYALSESTKVIKSFKKNSFKEFIPRATRIISLSQSADEILANMHTKGRYNAKVAAKKGLKVTKKININDFYSLLEKTANRDDFYINNKKYFEELFSNISSKKIHYYGIYSEEKLIASSIVLDYKDTAYYFYGASDHTYRNLMAPYLIQHTAILEAKKRGLKYYDFLGVSPYSPHPLDKVSEFKRKFGGQIVHFAQNKITVFKPLLFTLLIIRKSLKKAFTKKSL